MKRVIFNQKGGVGKTSITCNLAAGFAYTGKKVLVIDLDTQANSSQYLLGDAYNSCKKTVADFFDSTLRLKIFGDNLREALYPTPFANLWLIPADHTLAELQTKLESRYKIFKLAQAVANLMASEHFDALFIDTPPALNFYSMSALIACERVLIPFDCDAFSAHALLQVVDTVEEVREDHSPKLAVEGIIINHFQAQAKLPQEAIASLAAANFPILTPYLSSSIVMKESHRAHRPLLFHRPSHKLAQEYLQLAENLQNTSRKNASAKASAHNPRKSQPAKAPLADPSR